MKRETKVPKPKSPRPKCVRLINISAKLEVVMSKKLMDELGTYKLNAMNLIYVGLV